MKKEFVLSLCSGLLLAMAWPTYGFSFLAFFGITPLLFLVELIQKDEYKRKGWRVFGYGYFAFFIWNFITTWWIYNSTGFGAAFAILCNSSFYAIILTIYRWSLTRLPQKTSYLFMISFWMAFEKFHLNWDFSWPWLNLGNVFSESIYWIQWYEYTGAFGGTLWVLIVNFVGLKYLRSYYEGQSIKRVVKNYIPQLLWIAIPILISMVIYLRTTESEKTAKVIVLQPNLDPYQEKYRITNPQLLQLAKDITVETLNDKVDFLLTPEGYFDEGFGLNLSKYHLSTFYQEIKDFTTQYPNLSLVTGAQSFRLYPVSKKSPTETANQLKNNAWYDVYNSVFHFQNDLTDNYYHKSKLVVGVEYMPYKKYLEPIIGEFLLDFGGTIATRGIQKSRTVFVNKKGIKTAPIVCYESIYGAFVTEYVRNGAQFLSILTNDAWWGKTQGHQQLFSYARLRAIENRRAIARSANTGISGFINTKGEIQQTLAYEGQGALTGVVPLNSQLTFYSIYGDYLARWAIFLFGLFFFIALSGRLKEKAVF